jgi:protein TonB
MQWSPDMPSSALQPQRLALLALILLAHVALLWALSREARITPPEELPSAVMGMLIEQPPMNEPKPEPVVPPPPTPKPVVRPKPTPPPLPVAPPSERAVTAPEPPAEPVDVPTETVPEPETPVVAATEETVVSEEQPVTAPQPQSSYNPEPQYPLRSRSLNEQGTVILDLYVLADGTVGEIKVKQSSGYPRLDESALRTLRKWRFIPAKRDGESIAQWYTRTVEFSLKPSKR